MLDVVARNAVGGRRSAESESDFSLLELLQRRGGSESKERGKAEELHFGCDFGGFVRSGDVEPRSDFGERVGVVTSGPRGRFKREMRMNGWSSGRNRSSQFLSLTN